MARSHPNPLWDRITRWFNANAEHVTVEFIPDGAPIIAYQGYLRLWLAEGFLAKAATWGNKHFPVLHGGAALTYLGGTTPFTTFDRAPGTWTSPGARLDFALTPLLPFNGGVVEVEAALYQASTTGPLVTALHIMGGLSVLLTPPLSIAAAVVDSVAKGLDAALGTDQPELGVHWTMISPGGGGNSLRPGSLVVIDKPRAALPGTLSVGAAGLCLDNGTGPKQLSGVNYLVVRIECRRERDDWRFPELDALIRTAGEAYIKGYADQFEDVRTDAVARAWNSPDLTPADRKRVAKLVADEIDALRDLHAAPGPDRSIEKIAMQALPSRDDPALANLTLRALLAH